MSEELHIEAAQEQPAVEVQEQATAQPDNLELVKAQMVATAVDEQMSTREATQLAEAKHMRQEFEKYATDPTLPVEPYAIRNGGYAKYKNRYSQPTREPSLGVRGVQKEDYGSLSQLHFTDSDGRELEDPYAGSSDRIRHLESAVAESQAKLADMPIGPWNQVKRKPRGSINEHDTLVFGGNSTDEVGSAEYAKFAHKRAKTHAKIAELNEEIAQAEQQKADPSIDVEMRRSLDETIASHRREIVELEEGEGWRFEADSLRRIDKDEQLARQELERQRARLAEEYARGAEFYGRVSEELNGNLNNIAQQFEDFYNLAPDVFADRSSKDFIEAAKGYFGIKQDIREKESAVDQASGLVELYDRYTAASQPDSERGIDTDIVGIANLTAQVGRYFGLDTRRNGEWEYFREATGEGVEGEELKATIEEYARYTNDLGTAENLTSYVEFSRQIDAEWFDLSPRQTLERFSEFAKSLQVGAQEALRQKQDELNEFIAGLKGGQPGSQEDSQEADQQ